MSWKAESRRTDYTWEGSLKAYWEVALDPISDDFTPDEMAAEELLYMWAEQVSEHHPDGLVPISWYVQQGSGNIESMPFQHGSYRDEQQDDFLTYFTWPVDSETGAPLNWLELPVVDKLWRPDDPSKGGFIQEATGWKPSILQPFVFLPALLEGRRRRS